MNRSHALVLGLLMSSACVTAGTDGDVDLDDAADALGAGQAAVPAHWARLTADAVKATSTVPPHAARIYGYVALAMYEAGQTGISAPRSVADKLHHVGAMPRPERARYDRKLSVAAAAAAVLAELLPSSRATAEAELAAQRERSTASEVVKNRSQQFGEAVAAVLIERIHNDGFDATREKSYTPPTGISAWVPTGAQTSPLEPYWGTLAGFAGADIADYCARQAGPPVWFSTDADSAMYQQAYATYHAVNEPQPGDDYIAYHWADAPGQTSTPVGHWVEVAAALIEEERMSLTRATRTLALVGMAGADAFVTGWKLKYEHNLLRPVTYINRYIDPAWKPLLNTPPFPEYVSGHSVGSGAASAVLAEVLGDDYSFEDRSRDGMSVVDSGNDPHLLSSRWFASFQDAAEEAANSRLYGGIHYPMGNEGGLVAGRCVAEVLLHRLAR